MIADDQASTTSCSMSFSTKTQALLSLHFFPNNMTLSLCLLRHIKLEKNICAFHQPGGNPCDFSTAWQRIHRILNFKRFCISWSKLSFSCSLQRHWKRQPLFPFLRLPPPLWADRGAFNESQPAPAVFWTVSSHRQAAWVMEVTEKTPAPNHGSDREREKVRRRWGEEGVVPVGRNTQQGNKLGETITYRDRPGGAALLTGRRVGPGHGPSWPRWMGPSLRTKLILGV